MENDCRGLKHVQEISNIDLTKEQNQYEPVIPFSPQIVPIFKKNVCNSYAMSIHGFLLSLWEGISLLPGFHR